MTGQATVREFAQLEKEENGKIINISSQKQNVVTLLHFVLSKIASFLLMNFSARFGHVFNADTGTSTGEVYGQSKSLNNCAFRQSRPMKLVTASEDNSVAFFEGPPFKFKKTLSVSHVPLPPPGCAALPTHA